MDLTKLTEMLAPAWPAIQLALWAFALKYAASALGWVASAATEGLSKLSEKLDENEYLKKMRFDNWLIDRVKETVIAVKGEIVDGIKRASEDGKLSKDEIKEIKEAAFTKFKESLSKTEWSKLVSIFGDDLKNVILNKFSFVTEALKVAKEDEAVEEVVAEVTENPPKP